MRSAALPPDEQQRLEALHRLCILDTAPEAEFDDLARVAAAACGTPIALISLVDADRQWFKAKVGVTTSETPRDVAFCAHAIHTPHLFIVEDATKDERFHDNPLVTGPPHVRFYAGAPIVTREGRKLGTVCVIDTTPRQLVQSEKAVLESLARSVADLLEARTSLVQLRREIEERTIVEEQLREELDPKRLMQTAQMKRARLRPSPRSLVVMMVAALSLLGATFLLHRHEQGHYEVDAQARLDRTALFVTQAILRRLDEYSRLLDSTGALVELNGGEVSLAQWRTFTASLDVPHRYPGITGTGFIQYVPGAELEEFVARNRKERPWYTVYPPGSRDEYFAIRYIEPESTNRAAAGYDVGSEPLRRTAALRSVKTNAAAITEPIALVQDREKKPGFLMFFPARVNGRLAGWAYIAVRWEDFFRSLHAANSDEVVYRVVSRSGEQIFQSGAADFANDRTVAASRLDLLGAAFDISFVPRPFGSPSAERESVIPVAGTILTIFVVAVLWSFATMRARALYLASDMAKAHSRGERNMRGLIEGIADGVITIDGESRIQSFSRAASEIFGYASGEVLRKHLSFLLPEFRREMIAAGTPELQALRRDGSTRIVELSYGEVQAEVETSTVVIARDVTERRRAERETQFLQTFAVTISRARDEAELLENAVIEICAYLEWPFGEAWMPRDGKLVRFFSWHHQTEALARFDAESIGVTVSLVDDLPPAQQWVKPEPSVMTEPAQFSIGRPEAVARAGFRRAMAVPVRGDGEAVAGLLFFTTEPDDRESERHRKIIRTVAAQLSDAIRTKRAEAALRESEERYRDLFENSSDLIQSVGPDGRFLYVNKPWLQALGHESDELERLTIFDVVHPDDHDRCNDVLERVLRGEEVGKVETTFVTASGERRIVEGSVTARVVDGRPVSTRAIFRDVTEQRIAQQALRESRDRLRSVLDGATEVAIIATDAKGVIKIFNTGAERLLGYGAAEMIGKATPLAFHDPVEVANRGAELTVQLGYPVEGFNVFVEQPRKGGSEEREWTFIRKDGERRAVSLVVTATFGNDGAIDGFVGVARDVTEVKEAEASLRASQERLESLMENSLDGIITVNERSVIETVNPAAARLTGYQAAELIGRPLAILIPETVGDRAKFIRDAHRASIGAVTEWDIAKKSGEIVPVELSLFEFHTTDGRHFAGMMQDLSRRREVERMKKEFVSTVSHELRTPLTSIRGSLDLLSGGVFGEMSEESLEVIRIAHKNSTRLISLINDILDLERLDSGRLELTIEEMDVEPLVAGAIDSVRVFAEECGVTVRTEELRGRVLADSDRIVQVLVNLLSNAVKFSDRGGAVRVAATMNGKFVRIAVIDQGRGIPERFRQRVFDRFQQVESSDARSKGGTGLGLAICRAIVEQHGGHIGVESIEGHGSTFWFELPAAPAVVGEKGETMRTVVLRRGRSVDGDHLHTLLKKDGFTVIEEQSDARVVDYMRTSSVSIVLIDLKAEGSRDLIEAIYECDHCGDVPVVIISSSTPYPPIPMRGNVGLFLLELSDATELVSAIRTIIGEERTRQVLVVDDDEELLQVLGAQLTAAGVAVQTARSAEEALRSAHAKRPRLMVLDVGLVDGDGFDVIRAMRQEKAFHDLPVVVYTGRYLNHEEKRRLTLGTTRFLTKSRVTDEEFRSVVLSMLAEAR